MRKPRNTTTTLTDARLPKPPGVVRGWLSAHPGFINGIIVVFYVLGAGLMIALETFEDEESTTPYWLFFLITVSVAVCLWWRTRAPMVGLVITAVLGVLEIGSLQIANTVALVFFLYAIPVYRSVRAAWGGYAIALLSTVLSFLNSQFFGVSEMQPDAEGLLRQFLQLIIVTAIWYLAIVVIGINIGNRKRYVEALLVHAEQLVRDQEQQAQLATAAERARIAREMHDIIAHSLSVVVTLTEAAAVSIDKQPESAKFALQRASETGRNALSEMRRLLGVLNDSSLSSRAPQPQLSDLPQLCAGFTEAGLRISLSESGVNHADAGHQIAVYRIVQEALTNALRYAGSGAEVHIDLHHTEQETLLNVTDSGKYAVGMNQIDLSEMLPRTDIPATGSTAVIPGAGRGLVGAKQRAEMYGGELTAGAYLSGWQVTARLPYPESE